MAGFLANAAARRGGAGAQRSGEPGESPRVRGKPDARFAGHNKALQGPKKPVQTESKPAQLEANMQKTRDFHRRSIDDRDAFWRAEAGRIHWETPFGQVLDYSRPPFARWFVGGHTNRSEEHTSELQSLMRISYAVFCLKKKKT